MVKKVDGPLYSVGDLVYTDTEEKGETIPAHFKIRAAYYSDGWIYQDDKGNEFKEDIIIKK